MNKKIFGLLTRHRNLEAQLRFELAQRAPDNARISQLKKLKLAIKDRLQRFAIGRSQVSI